MQMQCVQQKATHRDDRRKPVESVLVFGLFSNVPSSLSDSSNSLWEKINAPEEKSTARKAKHQKWTCG
jgi:hypothetical protein